MSLTSVVPISLALAHAAHVQSPWAGPALVLEVDDHALTWTVVAAEEGEIRPLGNHVLTHLGMTAWKEKLLNWVAETCIRQSRRDPRAYPEIEQMLFEQLGRVITTQPQGQILELVIQRDQWYHNVLLRFEGMAGVCAAQVAQGVAAMDHLMTAFDPPGIPCAVVLSSSASRLPGLLGAVESHWEKRRVARAADPQDEEEPETRPVTVVSPGGVAESALLLAKHWVGDGAVSGKLVERLHVPPPSPAPVARPRLIG
jgi:hypothetical protein